MLSLIFLIYVQDEQDDGWHYVKSTNILPDSTVKLGQIIADHKRPRDRIGDDPIEISPDQIATSFNTGSEFRQVVNAEEKSISMSAKVRNLLAFRLEGNKATGRIVTHTIKKVEISEFAPKNEYAKKSLEERAVKEYLKQVKYKKRIFMICGLKIAHGAMVRDAVGNEYQGEGSVSLPLNVKGGTLGNAKGSVEVAKIGTKIHNVHATNSFIFAYRLREVKYTKSLQVVHTRETGKLHDLHDSSGSTTKPMQIDLNDQSGADDIVVFQCLSSCGVDEFEDDSTVVDGCILIGFPSHSELRSEGPDSVDQDKC